MGAKSRFAWLCFSSQAIAKKRLQAISTLTFIMKYFSNVVALLIAILSSSHCFMSKMETKMRIPHSVGHQLGMTLDDDFYEMALARPPSSFPLLNSSRQSIAIRNDIDYSLLKPDDPFFLDMPWPTEVGPAATAFSRHMAWKRRLSDGESK